MDDVSQTRSQSNAPRWSRWWLIAAGVYNIIWGAAVIIWPHMLFDLADIERMRYPEIWQCVGMVVGVYGIGYLIASRDSRRHWVIVLVGLLGKILGPIGFVYALTNDRLPFEFAITIVTNDLIWWIPFAMMLWDAARAHDAWPQESVSLDQALDTLSDQHHQTLRSLTEQAPTLTVLMRHAGCTFCRETLADLSHRQQDIRARGYQIAIISMAGNDVNQKMAGRYELESASWFSDPDRLAYRALSVGRGTFGQLFGPRVFLRGISATLRGHLIGGLQGDGFQMPGAFILENGRIVRSFRHRRASDRINYDNLACEMPP